MLIAGNWKMNKTASEAAEFCGALKAHVTGLAGSVDVAVFPPFTSLGAAVRTLADTEIAVGAQNVHWETEGPFTGEVSAPMLRERGVYAAIVGHSERRQHFGETDQTAARRASAALEAGLFVIACVGELEQQREAGETEDVLRRQVAVLSEDERLVIAYEPVWAIGTGEVATPEDAQEVCGAIRGRLAELYSQELADKVRIQYGGSVKSGNVAAIMAQPDVDGALVGGAALDADEFVKIVRFRDQ